MLQREGGPSHPGLKWAFKAIAALSKVADNAEVDAPSPVGLTFMPKHLLYLQSDYTVPGLLCGRGKSSCTAQPFIMWEAARVLWAGPTGEVYCGEKSHMLRQASAFLLWS